MSTYEVPKVTVNIFNSWDAKISTHEPPPDSSYLTADDVDDSGKPVEN